MDTLLRRRMMMTLLGGTPTPPTPPSPVTGAYIRNTDIGAYIDTGITPDSTTKVILWVRNFNPACGFLFGSREGTTLNTFGLGSHSNTAIGRIRVDYAQSNSTYADNQFTNLSHYHKYELYQGVAKVDDVTIATASLGNFSNNHNIHLFGVNNNGTHSAPVKMIDIFKAKIYKNDVLVRDYIAVNTPSVGLYDFVTGNLYTNAGSGSFTYGVFNQNAYVPLDYISCTNQQYIDTGIYGHAELPLVVKFRIIGTSVSNPRLFGTYRSGTSGTYFLLNFSNASYPNRYANFYIDSSTVYRMYDNNSTRLTNLDVVFTKDETTARLIRNNGVLGTAITFTASSSFSTSPDTLKLAAGTNNGTTGAYFNGFIYYAGFGNERNFVPSKVNDVAGFYDTYNDIFYPSETSTPFVAGNEI